MQLLVHEIDACDHFRNGMLDLQPRVDFKKIVFAFCIQHELDRAGVHVSAAQGNAYGSFAELPPEVRIDSRRRGLLYQLLVPALDRAFPFPQVYCIAAGIGEHLNFYMPWPLDVLLDIQRWISECAAGLGTGQLETAFQLILRSDEAHSLAAAARSRLEDDRESDLSSNLDGLFKLRDRALAAGRHGHSCFEGHPPG